ncbi:MAG TPA: hypothetical protein VMT59_13600 [Gaiellaceae bacterium]|nr:hypothetical protein [Gaiellaceae bacterium]
MADVEELVALALLAGREVPLDAEELRGALRRSLLLLAAGGDPHRGLELDGRAVTALADELDAPERRSALLAGLRSVAGETPDAELLLAEPELAWRLYACGLLAEELTED